MENTPSLNVQDFLEYLVKSIVSDSSSVLIERNMNSFDETYIIHVDPHDMGILIGKGGKNINAIRNLVSIKSTPNRIYVHVAEQEHITA